MKIKLVKTETEWSQPSLGCYISVNNNLVDVITPLNNPHEASPIEILPQGFLRLVIRDMGKSDGYLGSVSLPINLLGTEGSMIILPLFDSPTTDLINSIPKFSQIPRVTLMVLSDNENASSPKNIKYSIIQKENIEDLPLNKLCWNNEETEILQVFQKEVERLKEEMRIEKEKNSQVQGKYSELLRNLKVNCDRAQQREGLLLELIAEKEEKICKNIEINLQLQAKIRKLEFEFKKMNEKVMQFEMQEKYVQQLEGELKKYQELLVKVEKTRDELTNSLVEQSLSESSPDRIASILAEKVNNFENSDLNDSFMRKVIRKSIDASIPLGNITRIRDCLYKINEVEISIAICDDGLYAKIGNKLITLAEFWKLSQVLNPPNPVPISYLENEKKSSLNLITSNYESRKSPGLKFNAKSFSSIYSKN